jgi:predicted MFS family arabinose efflux permease
VLGGVIAEQLHWSVIFWINLPLGFAAYAMTSSRLKLLPRYERPHKLDIAGALLMTAATMTLLLALSWGGTAYPWLSLPIAALVAASLLLWAGFAWRVTHAQEPVIPLDVLANPVVRMGTLSAGFGMGTFIGLSIYLPLYFETIVGLSASHSGLGLLPLTCGTLFGATGSGRALAHLTHYKRVPVAGLAIALVGMGVLAATVGRMPLVPFCILLAVVSIGFGTLLPVATVSIQNAVKPHQLGTATGVANFFRQIGGALIVAVFGAIVLGGIGASGAGLSHEALQVGGVDRETMVGVFRYVFGAATVGFAFSLICLVRMKELPLRTGVAAAAREAAAE